MKKCPSCNKFKENNEFYLDENRVSGLRVYCKECHRIKNRKYEKSLKIRQTRAAYAKTEKGKEVRNNWKKRTYYRPDQLPKRRANGVVRTAVHRGNLKKPSKCPVCGQEGVRIDAHHEDYTKPYEIDWMCMDCHMKYHGKERVA